MSAIPRLLSASRRSYSSFFSSKSGGGRYFTSAKPPKASVIANATRQPSKSPAISASKPSDGPQDGGDVKHRQSGESTSEPIDAQSTSAPQPNSNSSPSGVRAEHSGDANPLQGDSNVHNTSSLPGRTTTSLPRHPSVDVKDFKLNQFFSLHRPLLLLSNPSSILYPVGPSDLFLSTAAELAEEPLFTSDTLGLPTPPSNVLALAFHNPSSVINAYDYTSEMSDSDMEEEAICQLIRALTLTKAGPMVEWEATLRRLGLDVEMEPERVGRRVQMERELERIRMERELDEVRMDSTKRKRRKKMKKHKLKKRRRLTRATRLKIGR